MLFVYKVGDVRLLAIVPNLDPIIPGTFACNARPLCLARVHHPVYLDTYPFAQWPA